MTYPKEIGECLNGSQEIKQDYQQCQKKAWKYMETDNYIAVLYWCKKRLKIAKESGNQLDIFNAYLDMNDTYRGMRRNSESLKYCCKAEKYAKICANLGSKWTINNTYITNGVLYKDLGDYEKARENYEKLIAQCNPKFVAEKALYYSTFCLHYVYLGLIKSARKAANDSLNIVIVKKRNDLLRCTYRNLAIFFSSICNYKKAIKFIKTSLEVCYEIYKVCASTAVLYIIRGNIFHDLALYGYAIENYKSAFSVVMRTASEDHGTLADAYSSYGLACQGKGNYRTALFAQAKAQDIWKKVNPNVFCKWATMIYKNIGFIFSELEYYECAIQQFEKALEDWNKTYGENHICCLELYNIIGATYLLWGKPKEAEQSFKKILQNSGAAKNAEICIEIPRSYNNVGLLYQYREQYELALDFHNKAINLFEELFDHPNIDAAYTYSLIGNVYCKMKMHKAAALNYQKALKLRLEIFSVNKNHPEIAKSYIEFGQMYESLGDNEKAIARYNKAFRLYEKLYSKIGIKKGHMNLVSLYKIMSCCYLKMGKEYAEKSDFYKVEAEKMKGIIISEFGKTEKSDNDELLFIE